ncbi:MAG: hypothetical protein FJ295_20415 [Planctomycetes bacterium]|nr:hypothetical protein [Planctomycetota bacterium]
MTRAACCSQRWPSRCVRFAFYGLALLAGSGCQPLHWEKGSFWPSGKAGPSSDSAADSGFWPWTRSKPEPAIPDRIMAIWTDTVLHQPGEPALRGFGGRIFFYQDKSKDPVEVDGGLAIYVFDADKIDPRSPTPERKFVFTADQFASHASRSELGLSYSVWLPWDEVGGPNRRLSIVTRFEGRNGGVVISQPTQKLLPGVDDLARRPASSNSSPTVQTTGVPATGEHHHGVRQVNYDSGESPPNANGNTKRRLQPQTIDLPPAFYDRNLKSPPQAEPQDKSNSTAESDLEIPLSRGDLDRVHSRNDRPASSEAQRRVTRPVRDAQGLDRRDGMLRREPFRAGWLQALPQTPRRPYHRDASPSPASQHLADGQSDSDRPQ